MNDSTPWALARRVLRAALIRAPNEPLVHLAASSAAFGIDHDTVGAMASVATALALAPNDAEVLSLAAIRIFGFNRDSAATLIFHAATLAPKSPQIAWWASQVSFLRKGFATARRYANTVIELDSTDERGWVLLFLTAQSLGDSLGMRQFSETMLRHVAHPGFNMAGLTIPANRRMSQWYLDLPSRDQRLFSFSDFLIFFDQRIDAAVVLGNETLAKRECERVVRLFNLQRANFDPAPDELAILAYAQATAGQELTARRTLAHAIGLARKTAAEEYPIRAIQSDRAVAAYDRLGDVVNTVAWMQASLREYHTTAWYSIHPRLASFRTTKAWRDFVKAHPVHAP